MRNLHPLATEARPTDGGAAVRLVRPSAGVDVPACARDMPKARATACRPEATALGMAGKEAGAVIVSRSGGVRIAAIRVIDFWSGTC